MVLECQCSGGTLPKSTLQKGTRPESVISSVRTLRSSEAASRLHICTLRILGKEAYLRLIEQIAHLSSYQIAVISRCEETMGPTRARNRSLDLAPQATDFYPAEECVYTVQAQHQLHRVVHTTLSI